MSIIHVNVWRYDNFLLQEINQKYGNRKYLRLCIAQYLETGAS